MFSRNLWLHLPFHVIFSSHQGITVIREFETYEEARQFVKECVMYGFTDAWIFQVNFCEKEFEDVEAKV